MHATKTSRTRAMQTKTLMTLTRKGCEIKMQSFAHVNGTSHVVQCLENDNLQYKTVQTPWMGRERPSPT